MPTIRKYKFYLLLVFFLIFSSNIVYTQNEKTPKCKPKKEIFAFGPKLSMNFTHEKIVSKEFSAGADLGLFFRISPGRLFFQPEINYQIRNMVEKMDLFPMMVEYKVRTHHIDVPILIGVKAVDLKLFKLRFFVGPEVCFRLKEPQKEKNFQLGFQVGLGLDIWRFTIDASYSFLGHIKPKIKDANSNILKIGLGFKCF